MATATLELTTSSRPYIFRSLGTPTLDNYNESSDFPIDSKYEFTERDIFPDMMGLMLIQQGVAVQLKRINDGRKIKVRIKYCDSDCSNGKAKIGCKITVIKVPDGGKKRGSKNKSKRRKSKRRKSKRRKSKRRR